MPATSPPSQALQLLAYARPKSVMCGRPSESIRMFDGFRSRWTSPARWAWWAASATGIKQRRDLRRRQPLAVQHLGKVSPLDVLEDDEDVEVSMMADVVNRHDRRMAQTRPRFEPRPGMIRLAIATSVIRGAAP